MVPTPCASQTSTPSQTSPTTQISQKRHRSAESREKIRKAKLPYNTGENVCPVTSKPNRKSKKSWQQNSCLEIYAIHTKVWRKNIEDPRNFPDAKWILTVISTCSGSRQTWGMVEETVKVLDVTTPLAILEKEEAKKLRLFCSGRVPVFVHLSQYRALKLLFP